jgi:tripartite-type tricarboxylate transporter receptor subunit TctC
MSLVVKTLLACAVIFGLVNGAKAEFPDKPVKFIVTSPPGGPTDLIARRFGDALSKRIGQSVIIENRAGGRTVGPGEVAKAAPDGYTLLFTVDTYLTVNPALFSSLPYDPIKDFKPVAVVASLQNFILAVHPSVPVKSVKEYVERAKSQPKELSAANAGVGSPAHLVTALFALKSDINLLHVSYRGGNLAINDLLGGHVASMFMPAQNGLGPIGQKQVVPLAVTGAERFALLPDVPTFAEAGFPAVDLNQGFWYGVVAPAATPAPIVAKLGAELTAIAESDEMKKSLGAMGIKATPLGPDDMKKTIADDTGRWGAIIREAGIKIE